jgi:hypothetical protein
MALRGDRESQRGRRAPVHYWITSSARASTDGGIVRPSAFAVMTRAGPLSAAEAIAGRGAVVDGEVCGYYLGLPVEGPDARCPG